MRHWRLRRLLFQASAFLMVPAGLLMAQQARYTFRKVADNAPGTPFLVAGFQPVSGCFCDQR